MRSKKFRAKSFRDFMVRLATKNEYYICRECGEVHKRDGDEINSSKGTISIQCQLRRQKRDIKRARVGLCK